LDKPERNGFRDPLIRVTLILFLLLSFFAAGGVVRGADVAAALTVRVVEGENGVYAAGSRATRGVTVVVSDAEGKPVEGATVSFALPASGPGGVFATGSRMEVAITRADGRAEAWGMQWNRTPGAFAIRITAAKGQARAAIVNLQTLAPADRAAASGQVNRGAGNHKWLWIAVAAAGAAVAGVAGAGLAKASAAGAAGSASSSSSTQIGVPTIVLGHP
jgi:hypothetical protein